MHDIAQMLMMGAGSGVVTRTVGGTSTQESVGAAAYTTAALSAGAATPDRLLVVSVMCSAGAARTTSGMTIGGVAATLLARSTYGGTETTLWAALVTTGTTAVVAATVDAAITAYALSMVALYGAKPTPYYTVTSNPGAGDTGAITGVPNGIVIASTMQASWSFNTSVVTVDASVTSTPLGSSTISCAVAFPKTSGTVGPLTSGVGGVSYVAASFAPI